MAASEYAADTEPLPVGVPVYGEQGADTATVLFFVLACEAVVEHQGAGACQRAFAASQDVELFTVVLKLCTFGVHGALQGMVVRNWEPLQVDRDWVTLFVQCDFSASRGEMLRKRQLQPRQNEVAVLGLQLACYVLR